MWVSKKCWIRSWTRSCSVQVHRKLWTRGCSARVHKKLWTGIYIRWGPQEKFWTRSCSVRVQRKLWTRIYKMRVYKKCWIRSWTRSCSVRVQRKLWTRTLDSCGSTDIQLWTRSRKRVQHKHQSFKYSKEVKGAGPIFFKAVHITCAGPQDFFGPA